MSSKLAKKKSFWLYIADCFLPVQPKETSGLQVSGIDPWLWIVLALIHSSEAC